jgi:glycosyltransferase involved in cell wall biosynthesis
MSSPLISVILTCYNQGRFLKQSVQSLLDQDYQAWECFLINDGSTDESDRIATQLCDLDDRLTYLFQENKGVSASRNKGLELANGDFIQFLDADDFIHPKKFSTQIEFIKSQSPQAIVFGSSRFSFESAPEKIFSSHFNGGIPSDLNAEDQFQVEFLIKNNACSNCAPLYPKAVREQIRFKQCIYEDWVFNLECALLGLKFHFFNDPNCTSFIRMTESSQMIQHTTDLGQIKKFKSLLLNLVSTYNYSLDPHFQSILTLETNTLKRFAKGIIPPFFYDFLSQFKSKLLG